MRYKMTNHRLQTSKEIPPMAKRKKRVSAAVAQDIVTSEDDDNVTDGMDICDIIENHTLQHKESTTSQALHALGETIRKTLLEINEIREQNRERRHKELLAVLAKMAEYESGDIGKSEIFKTKINNIPTHKEEYKNGTTEKTANHIIEENLSDNNTNTKVGSKLSTTILRQQESNQLPENGSSIVGTTNKNTNISSVHIVTAKNSFRASPVIDGKGQVNAMKGVFAVKQDSKEELQKMRVKMLELQRRKMEDRERKKRELQQRFQHDC